MARSLPVEMAASHERSSSKLSAPFWSCAICTCHMTHSCMWRDSLEPKCPLHVLCNSYVLIHMCDMTHSYEGSASTVEKLLRDMTHSYVWHDWFLRLSVTWLIHMCDLTHSYKAPRNWVTSCLPVAACDLTGSRVRHDSFTRVTWFIHTCKVSAPVWSCGTWFIHIWVMTHSYALDKLLETRCTSLCFCVGTWSRRIWLIHTWDTIHWYKWSWQY